jgi:transcriptional regulator with GAF, ATPase, and Fis domain
LSRSLFVGSKLLPNRRNYSSPAARATSANYNTSSNEKPASTVERSADTVPDEVPTAAELRVFTATNIQRAMAQTGGKIYGVAELLDMKPTTLASRSKSLVINTDS